MEKNQRRNPVPHCLVLPYPLQGHINPMLQFSKRLIQNGVKITLANTVFISKTLTNNNNLTSIQTETISDGYDDGGFSSAENIETYKQIFWKIGPKSLSKLLQKLQSSNNPVDVVVYDAFLNWSFDVVKSFGIRVAVFLTQSCSVDSINFHASNRWIELPILSRDEICLPGLPKLEPADLPSFLYRYGTDPSYFDILLNQFLKIDEADWVLVNTFYELEPQVVDWLRKIWNLKTIGPCVPSMFLDKRLEDDKDYGISIFGPNSEACIQWLDTKPKNSVVYVSFGSLAGLSEEQTNEMALALRDCGSYFIWVVRESDQSKLAKEFVESSKKGLIVTWCPQLEVLTHEAVGCFVTHCGWNSTLEALSVGVPIVAMPLWTDQITNAKLLVDVWKIGVKAVGDEKGVVGRETIKDCIREVMETEKGNELKSNAAKWKNLAKNSVDEGGSSDKNIVEFVNELKL